ncbi:hypothetical protein C9426_24975 [Serratia sp. S1B]|nr:hypothetical protein C9426_24975 [Serratia sp. S1B]
MKKYFTPKKRTLIKIFGRELDLVIKNKSLFIIFCFYPILTMILLCSIFYSGVITHIPIAVVDQDKTVSSRLLIRNLSATPQILIKERFNDLTSARNSLAKGDIYGVILVPPDFEKHVLAGHSPEVTSFYNNQFMSVGTQLNQGISLALSDIILQIETINMTNQGEAREQAAIQLQPILTDIHPLFNPTLNYLLDMVSGVYPAILEIVIMLSIVFSIKNDPLIVRQGASSIFSKAPLPKRLLVGKVAFYCTYYTLFLMIFDAFMLYYCGPLPIINSIILTAASVLFVLVVLLYGVFFSLLTNDKPIIYGLIGVVASPGFTFSGLMFPRIAMNSFAYIWSALIPVTWYIQVRMDLTLRMVTPREAFTSLLGLILQFIGVSVLILFIIQIKTLINSRKNIHSSILR